MSQQDDTSVPGEVTQIVVASQPQQQEEGAAEEMVTTKTKPTFNTETDAGALVDEEKKHDANSNNSSKAQEGETKPEKKKLYEEGQDIISFEDGSWIYYVNRPAWLNILLLFVLICGGFLEGLTFHRMGIVDPFAIYGQMIFKTWIVMKMFTSAIGACMILQGIMEMLMPTFFHQTRASRYNKRGYLRNCVGGLLIGIGMALSGSGMSVLPAGLGSAQVHFGWMTALGVIAGVICFGIVDKLWLSDIKITVDNPDDETLVVDEYLEVRYWKLAIPGGCVMFGFACVLDFVVVPKEDEQMKLTMGKVLWPGVTAGAVIGMNQVFFRIFAHRGMCGSTGLLTLLSLFSWGNLAPYAFPKGVEQFWELLFSWLGTSLGGFTSAQLTTDVTKPSEALHPARLVVGGFLAMMGARVAGGCACGNGVTGSSELSLEGFATTICIFVGGIATGYIVLAAS